MQYTCRLPVTGTWTERTSCRTETSALRHFHWLPVRHYYSRILFTPPGHRHISQTLSHQQLQSSLDHAFGLLASSLRYEQQRMRLNPVDSKGNATSNIRSWYTGRWWVGCYSWYSEDGPGQAVAPPSPILAVSTVTAHPSAASVPITVLLYDGPLLCGFNLDQRYAAPAAWNSLPTSLHQNSTTSFKRQLKSFLFQQAFT